MARGAMASLCSRMVRPRRRYVPGGAICLRARIGDDIDCSCPLLGSGSVLAM